MAEQGVKHKSINKTPALRGVKSLESQVRSTVVVVVI